MEEFLWVCLSIILGITGGYFNILLSDEGFISPYEFKDKDNRTRLSPGSWRELILGGGAGFISCIIAISTSEPTIWTIILYSIFAGISGGSYLEKLANTYVAARINEYNKELDKLEQENSSKGGEE
ncbi:hypothetical protein [Oceanobacillus salinisoli]|uniref:hypothetical protein n=1 Tax=Oceanobacillus salinisoli TaxID=2678611 RepID=UPI0012E1D52E|nr:hypothetical protein [Oceanobacillus salinisoli]